MLASDEDRALDALKFSMASEIVELLVLTGDDVLLQTLREAVGGARRLWHVPTADKVSDLLVAGEVGIVVLDARELQNGAARFITEMKRQFPDLVVLVAGTREAETALATLISSGVVYRFIHKPVSPGRAKLFADAAVRKYSEQRKHAIEAPAPVRALPRNRGLLIGGALCAAALIVAAVLLLRHKSTTDDRPSAAPGIAVAPGRDSLLTRAAAALAANRLTDPPGNNALELYLQASALNPLDAASRAGILEVRERLLARAEDALLEERLDDAQTAIETARRSGVEAGRIAFLSAQLGKAREQLKSAQARPRVPAGGGADPVTSALNLATQRMTEGRLIDSGRDNARFYVEEALSLEPANAAAKRAERALAVRLLSEARGSIDRREFDRAAAWLDAAAGIAGKADLDAVRQLLAGARGQAETDSRQNLLKNANERLQQDRLTEPPNDNAKYYLMTLRGVDPANAGLPGALSDLGSRLVAKARHALAAGQAEAARNWLDEATAIGYSAGDYTPTLRDLESVTAHQQFLNNIVASNKLTLIKSIPAEYPEAAERNRSEGWVELDFTVTETGEVRDIAVHDASAPGVFDKAASQALAQWRYRPVVRDGKPAAQRARIRMRFVVPS
jgi:TonB family protein